MKFNIDEAGNIRRIVNPEELRGMAEENRIFPLQTIQSMAERWRVSRQAVNNWAARHPDFPKVLDGVVESTAKTPAVYPLCEIERYERERGLCK